MHITVDDIKNEIFINSIHIYKLHTYKLHSLILYIYTYITYKLCTSLLMILKMKSPLMTQLIIEMEIKSRTNSSLLHFQFL